jgi:hypothetical protein
MCLELFWEFTIYLPAVEHWLVFELNYLAMYGAYTTDGWFTLINGIHFWNNPLQIKLDLKYLKICQALIFDPVPL